MGEAGRWSSCRGVSFRHPGWWHVIDGGEFVCIAVEPPRHDGGFRANLVLTVVDNGQLSFRDWQAGTDRLLPILLEDYEVIDLERLPVAGHPGGRRSAVHRGPCGRLLMANQWFTSVDHRGMTLTGTAEAMSSGLVNRTFLTASRTLRMGPIPNDEGLRP